MITIIIADDNKEYAAILQHNLQSDSDIKVIGIAADGVEAAQMSKDLQPHIVLMDLQMPYCDGIKGTALVKQVATNTKVIVLTTFDEDKGIAEALKEGADSYVLKEIDTSSLLSIIKNVHKGLAVMQDKVLQKMKRMLAEKKHFKPSQDQDNIIPEFSVIEIEIMKRICAGCSNKEIAKCLHYSEGTIKNIITKILQKASLQDRTQLAVFAVRNNIV